MRLLPTNGRRRWRSQAKPRPAAEIGQQRFLLLKAFIILLFGILGLQLVRMQVVEHAEYDARAESNRLRTIPELEPGNLRQASLSLVSAGLLLPGGFFLGGVTFYRGDPGIGIVLVPIGAAFLGIAVYLIARSATAMARSQTTSRDTKSKRGNRRESR